MQNCKNQNKYKRSDIKLTLIDKMVVLEQILLLTPNV